MFILRFQVIIKKKIVFSDPNSKVVILHFGEIEIIDDFRKLIIYDFKLPEAALTTLYSKLVFIIYN